MNRLSNAGVDPAGRCLSCGRFIEMSAGCTPCWQRRMSEAASTVLSMVDATVMPVYHHIDPVHMPERSPSTGSVQRT